jgi:hypothetical protein
MTSLLDRYLAPSKSKKICEYPNCNKKKEGRNFDCCPDHHCAHFRTSVTCFGVRQADSTACSTHQCRFPLDNGVCKRVSSNGQGWCDQHEESERERARRARESPDSPVSVGNSSDGRGSQDSADNSLDGRGSDGSESSVGKRCEYDDCEARKVNSNSICCEEHGRMVCNCGLSFIYSDDSYDRCQECYYEYVEELGEEFERRLEEDSDSELDYLREP